MKKYKNLLGILAATSGIKAFGFCGPHATQYNPVNSSLYASTDAVLCLFVVDNNSYAYYSEGLVEGKTFRTLGYINRSGSLIGRFNILSGANYTIVGNGEQDPGYHATSMHLIHDMYDWNAQRPPQTIVESNVRPTVWKIALSTYRRPANMPLLRHCGPSFRTYRVQGAGDAVRCLLDSGDRKPAAWIGAGSWGGQEYLHIGTAFFAVTGPQYGAADLCAISGSFCAKVPFGQLGLSAISAANGRVNYNVNGAWSETWVQE